MCSNLGDFCLKVMEEKKKTDSAPVSEKKYLQRLRNQCARREYCSSDILNKAVKALGDSSAAERILESLKNDAYVNDARYAAAYAREKAAISGWGIMKIRYMLSSKGISPEDLAAGLAEIDNETSSKRLRKLLEVKALSLKDDPQRRLKLLKFALGRGYAYDQVAAQLACLDKNE